MIRYVTLCVMGLGLAACGGDGLGTQYSSARAQVDAPAYIAVTPGAVPVNAQGLPVEGGAVQPVQRAVLDGPVAITPGAEPILPDATPEPITVTGLAPAASLKPATAPSREVQPVLVAAAAPRPTSAPSATSRRYARGQIYTACREAGRDGATDSRCGCVQWVADQRLSAAEQRRGAAYFTNQQGVQDARQSDRAADEQFWDAWKAFGEDAGRLCRGT